ncbi:MAG: hypothetical protein ACREBU_06795 [Nitrososphaera sp.]
MSRLREANGKWVEKLEISEEVWLQIKKETFAGIFAIMESVKIILDHIKHPSHVKDNTLQICAGLYTFALEEYGKLLILQEYSPSNGKVIIDYARIFRSHPPKFKKALDNLPTECILLHKGGSGANSGSNFDIDQIADLQGRLAIFYADLRDDASGILKVPAVDKNRLIKVIDEFEKAYFGMKI